MLSLIEPAQPLRFPTQATGPARTFATATAADPTVRVIDSASYQALLARLGLTPDPRLCVPAVER